MDDQTQNPQSGIQNGIANTTPPVIEPVVVDDPVQPLSVVSSDQPVGLSQPTVPVGSMHKEAGPMRVETPITDVLTPSEKAPELPEEVEQAGVEVSKNPEVPDLTIHDKKAGIEHAPVIAPVPVQPSGVVQLPITEEKAEETLKKAKNTRNSITWLSELVVKHIKQMHGKLKGE